MGTRFVPQYRVEEHMNTSLPSLPPDTLSPLDRPLCRKPCRKLRLPSAGSPLRFLGFLCVGVRQFNRPRPRPISGLTPPAPQPMNSPFRLRVLRAIPFSSVSIRVIRGYEPIPRLPRFPHSRLFAFISGSPFVGFPCIPCIPWFETFFKNLRAKPDFRPSDDPY